MTSPSTYTDIVAQFMGPQEEDRAARWFPRPVVGTATLAVGGLTLTLASAVPVAVDALLAVGSIGLAAARYAATMSTQPVPSVGRRPANDNPLRPVLPPHFLRC